MVLAWIVAAFALIALAIVTVLYLRRTTTYKAIISGGGGGGKGSRNGSLPPAKVIGVENCQ